LRVHLPRPTGANDANLEFFIHSRSSGGFAAITTMAGDGMTNDECLMTKE